MPALTAEMSCWLVGLVVARATVKHEVPRLIPWSSEKWGEGGRAFLLEIPSNGSELKRRAWREKKHRERTGTYQDAFLKICKAMSEAYGRFEF